MSQCHHPVVEQCLGGAREKGASSHVPLSKLAWSQPSDIQKEVLEETVELLGGG